MGDVVNLNTLTSLDIDPERVIKAASEADLASVVICGWDQDGKLHFQSSIGSNAETLLTLELCKKWLLELVNNDIEQRGAEEDLS